MTSAPHRPDGGKWRNDMTISQNAKTESFCIYKLDEFITDALAARTPPGVDMSKLNSKERALLEYLHASPGSHATQENMRKALYGDDDQLKFNIIKVLIRQLRRKIRGSGWRIRSREVLAPGYWMVRVWSLGKSSPVRPKRVIISTPPVWHDRVVL